MPQPKPSTPEPPAATQAEFQQVAVAAAQAAQGEDTPKAAEEAASAAARSEAQTLKLSDEDAEKLADFIVEHFRAAGAFDPPPAAPAAPAASETPAGEPPAAAVVDEVPKKRTFAEKFVGLG